MFQQKAAVAKHFVALSTNGVSHNTVSEAKASPSVWTSDSNCSASLCLSSDQSEGLRH